MHCMNETPITIVELADELERLRAFQIASPDDMDRWYTMARKLEDRLTIKGGLSPAIPEFVWQYLADADIRFKDETYRKYQDDRVRYVVHRMRYGVMPTDDDIKSA
jgi:hypothetical protein